MGIARDHLIFSPFFVDRIKSSPLVLVDAGARGGLEEPWRTLDELDALRVIGFEPDEEECRRLNAQARSRREYLPYALWSSAAALDLYLTADASASSIYPPNYELLSVYRACHRDGRLLRKKTTVRCAALDAVVQEKRCAYDFLKIDVHGAEYQVLQGARQVLADEVTGVLVETWTSEVYRGQGLTGDIMTLMADAGFTLFDVGIAAAWRRDHPELVGSAGKAQVMGLDLLFFKEPIFEDSKEESLVKVMKAAAVADVFGFFDYAVALLDAAIIRASAGRGDLIAAKRMVIASSRRSGDPVRRICRRFTAAFGRKTDSFAALHY